MVTRAIAAAAGAVLLALPAGAAEKLPTWAVTDTCRSDSAPGQCQLFEGRARNAVSASWDVLPPEVQEACIAETSAPADQNWRTLAICIEHQILRAKSERAIATGATPYAPEPSAQSGTGEPAAPEPSSDQPTAAQPAAGEAAATTTPSVPAEPAKAQ